MKKSLLILAAVAVGFSQTVHADIYAPIIRAMVDSGLVESKTVKNNLFIYDKIVTSIEKKLLEKNGNSIEQKMYVISQLKDLQIRLDKQPIYSRIVAIKLNYALSEAKEATLVGNNALVLNMVRKAKQNFKEINNSIK